MHKAKPAGLLHRSNGLTKAVKATIGIGLFAFAAFLFMFSPLQTYAATASTINFQARLENANGSIAPDGTYNVSFHLYNTNAAGATTGSTDTTCGTDANCLWSEDYLNSNSQGIAVHNGYLTVQLGSICPFTAGTCQGGTETTPNWSQQLYLTMDIGGTTTLSWDGQMTPLLPLTAVPYSFAAAQASQLVNSTVSGSH